MNIKDQPFDHWLVSFIARGNVVGFDAKLYTAAQIMKLIQISKRRLVQIVGNLVDKVWINRPIKTLENIDLHPMKYAGQTTQAKNKLSLIIF